MTKEEYEQNLEENLENLVEIMKNGSYRSTMEGFWGIIKRESYYGKKFTSRESIVEMIEKYIEYYNNRRLQRNLGVLTPMEKHGIYIQAA